MNDASTSPAADTFISQQELRMFVAQPVVQKILRVAQQSKSDKGNALLTCNLETDEGIKRGRNIQAEVNAIDRLTDILTQELGGAEDNEKPITISF